MLWFVSAPVWSHSALVWEHQTSALGTASCSQQVLLEVLAAWDWQLDPGLGSLGLNFKQSLSVDLEIEFAIADNVG